MNPWEVIAIQVGGLVVLAAAAAALVALRRFAAWSIAKEEARGSAASFEADFIPDSSEVYAAEAKLGLLS
jgi:hypothetical protein